MNPRRDAPTLMGRHVRRRPLNRQSRTAIERLGARQDGVIRGHIITGDGAIRDTVIYSILAHEWPQVRLNLDYRLARHEETT